MHRSSQVRALRVPWTKLQLGNAVIFRAIFVRKKLRHQSALAYALAKAEVEELKPGAVLSQRTKRTPFMQRDKE